MSDDSFIREVEDELRSDQLNTFWSKYKYLVIGGAVALVLGTAGKQGWDYWQNSIAAASGDRFIAAVELSNDGKHDEAIAALESLSADGSGQYPALAKIRLAAEFAKNDEPEKAVEAFDAIAGDSSFDESLRNVARLRSGLLLVDHGSYDEVAERLLSMADTGKSFRHSAREGLGLSAWKAKDYKQALVWFSAITEDGQAPAGVQERARIMMQLLAGQGVKPEETQEG
ncbi:MAG: tetratricopeptide repeat protein [Rhizobiaceae bacterium]|nr:tetratricopeptide repeat protein [Rhizobiaceae bacterium]